MADLFEKARRVEKGVRRTLAVVYFFKTLGAAFAAGMVTSLGSMILGARQRAGIYAWIAFFAVCLVRYWRPLLAFATRERATKPEPVAPPGPELAAVEEETPEPEPELAPQPEPEPPTYALGLGRELRMRHVYCIGKSGTGKTTLLKQLLLWDFNRGDGCAFIDPHGDAAEELLGSIPDHRIKDVTYFDPTRADAPAFNLLALPYPTTKLAEDILSTFRLLFGTSVASAPRLEHLLRFSVLTLLTDTEPHSIKDLQTLLRRPDYRADVVARVTNEQVREFWEHEFPKMPRDATAPILNKLSALLMPTSDLERVLSSTTNAIDFPAMLDGGGIFIANLSKGKLGDEPSRLLGALLATAIQQAALARADRPAAQRRDFYFYVDEFQNYAVSSFSTILSEARKYNLALTLANQTLAQIPTDIRDAIFGNVATLIAFQVSSDDAARIAREMTSTRTIFRNIQDGQTFTVPEFNDHLRNVLPQIEDALDKRVEKAVTDSLREFSHGDAAKLTNNVAMMMKSARTLRHNGTPPKEKTLSALHWSEFQALKFLRDTLAARDLLPEHLRQVLAEDFGIGERLRDYFEVREETTPTAQDFLNLQPLHAFLRIERAENVSPLTVVRPPPPEETKRDAILAEQAQRARAATPPPTPERPPPQPTPETSPATTEEAPRASLREDAPQQSRRDKHSF